MRKDGKVMLDQSAGTAVDSNTEECYEIIAQTVAQAMRDYVAAAMYLEKPKQREDKAQKMTRMKKEVEDFVAGTQIEKSFFEACERLLIDKRNAEEERKRRKKERFPSEIKEN